MPFFSKKLSVGNRILDSEHKKLQNIIKGISSTLSASDASALQEAFGLLENCLHAYFAVEENIAQALNFDFAQHRLTHQCLLNEFRFIRDELMIQCGTQSRFNAKAYIDNLMDCLIQHIQEDSKPLKIVLDTHFYDFKPPGLLAPA